MHDRIGSGVKDDFCSFKIDHCLSSASEPMKGTLPVWKCNETLTNIPRRESNIWRYNIHHICYVTKLRKRKSRMAEMSTVDEVIVHCKSWNKQF